MCGGIGFSFSATKEDDLKRFFKPEEIDSFKKSGEVQSFFWQEKPVLPVKTETGVKLYGWGNRDKNIDLPKTGWARSESLASKKWERLNPETVIIPARRGYEKKIWFNLTGGVLGILVKRPDREVVYMVTEEADDAYKELTKHDRMPAIINSL